MTRLSFLILLLWLAGPVLAVPITYQGQLQDTTEPFTGSVEMDFRLYENETGGGALDVRTEIVSVSGGLFQVELDFGNQPYEDGLWLGISVDGEALEPRQRISAVPFALRTLAGGFWSDRSDGAIGYMDGTVAVTPNEFVSIGEARFIVQGAVNQPPMVIRGTGGAPALRVNQNRSVSVGTNYGATSIPDQGLRVVGPTILDSDLDVDGSVGVEGSIGIRAPAASTIPLRVRRETTSGTIFRLESGSLISDWVLRVTGQPSVQINGRGLSPQRQLHVRQDSNNNSTSGITLQRAHPNSEQWGLYVATSNDLILVYEDQAVGRFNSTSGTYTATSDSRLKRDIEPLAGVLDRFLELNPSSYRMTSAKVGGERQLGLIAQEVQALFPEVVSQLDSDQDELLGISYDKVAVLNTQALIEMNARYEDLVRRQQERIAALERQLERQISETEERIAKLEQFLIPDQAVVSND